MDSKIPDSCVSLTYDCLALSHVKLKYLLLIIFHITSHLVPGFVHSDCQILLTHCSQITETHQKWA
jgi:hypothetical protein